MYQPVVRAFLRKLGVEDGDLEDARQEVFARLFRYLPTFRGQAELSTWLYRLCVTEARNVRHRLRTADTARRLFRREPPAWGATVGALVYDETTRRVVDTGLGALSERERLVFVLHEMGGLKGDEIARIAGCPLGTVWRRLHCARRTFRSAVAPGHAGGGRGPGYNPADGRRARPRGGGGSPG